MSTVKSWRSSTRSDFPVGTKVIRCLSTGNRNCDFERRGNGHVVDTHILYLLLSNAPSAATFSCATKLIPSLSLTTIYQPRLDLSRYSDNIVILTLSFKKSLAARTWPCRSGSIPHRLANLWCREKPRRARIIWSRSARRGLQNRLRQPGLVTLALGDHLQLRPFIHRSPCVCGSNSHPSPSSPYVGSIKHKSCSSSSRWSTPSCYTLPTSALTCSDI